jgi:hypothetical protein
VKIKCRFCGQDYDSEDLLASYYHGESSNSEKTAFCTLETAKKDDKGSEG